MVAKVVMTGTTNFELHSSSSSGCSFHYFSSQWSDVRMDDCQCMMDFCPLFQITCEHWAMRRENCFLENIASCTRELSRLLETLSQGQDSVEVIMVWMSVFEPFHYLPVLKQRNKMQRTDKSFEKKKKKTEKPHDNHTDNYSAWVVNKCRKWWVLLQLTVCLTNKREKRTELREEKVTEVHLNIACASWE